MSDPAGADLGFMRLALAQAALAEQAGEVPVGAVVVHQGRVIAQGHNQTLGQQDITAHAEIQALRQASEVLGNHRLDDCELYVTLEPCLMCSGALMGARIARLVYGASEPRTGAAGSVLNVFADPRLNHHTRVQGGVLGQACAAAMARFFQGRRQAQAIERSATYLRDDALRCPATRLPAWPQGLHSAFVHDGPALDGHRLHVLAAGQGAEQALVLLHGPAQWSAAYATAALELAQAGLAVYAPDLLGFGLSDKPKKAAWHTLERHAQVLREYLSSLSQPRVCLALPASMAALVQGLGLSEGLSCVWIDEPTLAPELERLPYPDAGHRVGPQQLPGLLQGQPAVPQTAVLSGPDWPGQLAALIASRR